MKCVHTLQFKEDSTSSLPSPAIMFAKKDSTVVFEYLEFNFLFIIGDEISV